MLMKLAETKFKDQVVTGQVFAAATSYTQNVISVTDINQGTGQGARIGNAIQATGIYARFHCSSFGDGSNYFRIVLYTPRIIGDQTLPASDTHSPIDPDEFVVWQDKLVAIVDNPGGGMGIIQWKTKFKPYMNVIYTGGIGDDDVTKGELLLLIMPEAASVVELNGYIRLYFRDV